MQQVGIEITRARERLGLSREVVADLVGIHWLTLLHIERGGDCKLSTYRAIAEWFEERGVELEGVEGG